MKEIFLSSQKKSGLHLKVTAIHYDECTKRKIMFFILQVLSSQIGIYAYLHRQSSKEFKFCFEEEKIILQEKSDHASISEKLGHRSSTPAYPPSWLKRNTLLFPKEIHWCFKQNKLMSEKKYWAEKSIHACICVGRPSIIIPRSSRS